VGGAVVHTQSYRGIEMNKWQQEAEQLAAQVLEAPSRVVGGKDQPQVSLSASVKDDRALLSLTHLSADADCTVSVDLRGRDASVLRARVLTGESTTSFNDAVHAVRVAPVAL